MQQIELYYTNSLKYLKLGDYIKYFENENIDDMLGKIKNQDTPVLIRALKEDVIRHKLSDNSKVIYTYEEIIEEKVFDYDKVQFDYESDVSYALYPVNEKWHNLLGKEIYFCKDRAIQLFLVKDRDVCTFLYEDWRELKKNVLEKNEIGEILVSKMWLTDAEIAQEIAKGNLATQEGR